MRRTSLLTLLLGVGTLSQGCYRESFDYWTELDTVVTIREPDRDFSEYRTFAMPEQVFDLSDRIEEPIEVTDEYDQDILDRIAENLADRGWTRVGDVDEADVLVLNGKVASEFSVYYYYYWYYPYWIYYPPQTVQANYPVGTLNTIMVKPDETELVDGLDTVPAIWHANAFGVLDVSSTPLQRIEGLIDQEYDQSTYLEVGDAVDPIYGLDVELPEPDGGDQP